MPLSDFMPRLREGNMWTNYRNVLGVPIRKRMVIAVIAVFVLFLVFVCAFILAKSDRRSPSSGAAYLTSYVPISSAMNLSVDPCSDFYEFTCGLWGKSQPIHSNDNERVTAYGILKEYFDSKTRAIIENTNTRSEFPAVVNDAITFYKECISGENVDKGDLSYLKSYFEEVLGEWPLFKNSNNTLFDWRKASALLVKTLGVVTIFDMYIVADDYNTSQRILYLRAPDISDLPLGQDESQAMEMLYSVFSALNYDDQPGVYDVIENILDTETEWKKIFSNSTVKSQTLRITFKELNNLIPDMDWLFFFQIAMNDTLNELGTNIKPDDVVQIDSLETIKNAVAFFSSDTLSKKEIANLFGWLAVRKFSCLIPGRKIPSGDGPCEGDGNSEKQTIDVLVFEDIQNMKEIKEKLMQGLLKAAVVNPNFVFHVDQLIFASQKCLYNAKHEQLKTKSLFTELLYNLFPTRSIREALKTFGVQDKGTAAIFVTFNDDGHGVLGSLTDSVKGTPVSIEKIRELRDIASIKKLYKIPQGITEEEAVLNLILTKIAAKELLLS